MNTPTHTGAWEFKGEIIFTAANSRWTWNFDAWTRCKVKDEHDGLWADGLKSPAFDWLSCLVSDMRGEWREPMEKTFRDLNPDLHAKESAEHKDRQRAKVEALRSALSFQDYLCSQDAATLAEMLRELLATP